MNVDVPLFTESCLILTDSCVNIGEIFRDVIASNNLSLSKFQVCCLSPAYAEQNAPVDLLPFIHYLRFWCGVFVKMDGSSALEYSEEFIEIMDRAGDLLSNILRKNASIQVYRGTVDVNQKMNRIFLLQSVCVSFHTELLRKFPVALRLLEVVQKDPTSIKCLFDKMFGASSKIAWKMHPKEVSCVYLRHLVAIWVRLADVVSCICPPRGGWGNQSGPGKDCRAPFKCRLLKTASSSRPPWAPHSWSDQRNSTKGGTWFSHDIDNHKLGGNGDGGINISALSPADIQKKDLAISLFASLLSAETVCTLKPYWYHWRHSVSMGVTPDRVLLVMAFKKFSKKLGRTLSSQKRYRIFQEQLCK